MNESLINLEDEYLLSIDDIIEKIAQGVANAQRALDEQSLELQRKIYTDESLKSLRDVGIQATWYKIPEVTASIKVCLSIHTEKDEATNQIVRFLWFMPYNATTKTSYELDYEGTSEVSFKIVPVPTPTSASYTTVPNLIEKPLSNVESILKQAGLILGTTTEEGSDQPINLDTITKEDYIVINQIPETEITTSIGGLVNVTISKKQNNT